MTQIPFEGATIGRFDDFFRVRQRSLKSQIANRVIPLALLLLLATTSVQAGLRGPKAKRESNYQVIHGRLMVVGVTVSASHIGLRAGDQIVAVNGRRVSTEAALMGRLSIASNSTQAATITVARNDRLQQLNVPAQSFGGFMNPNLMVMTSQGVMHRDAAARLGLVGTPITGSPE